MPDVREQPVSAKPPDGSRRVYVWWGVGMGLLTILGLFCWLIAAPYLQVLGQVNELCRCVIVSGRGITPEEVKGAVERLGGPEKALSKIRLYLRMPQRVAPWKQHTLLMLGECGEPAVDTLVEGLWHKYGQMPEDSISAAWALGRIGPQAQRAIPDLVGYAVSIGHNEVYIEAMRKIDPQGSDAVPRLIEPLSHAEARFRSGAAKVLGFYGPAAKATVPLLIKALDDPATARAAARALAGIGPDAREAVPALIKALGSQDISVRHDAIWALGRIGPEAGAAAPAFIDIVKQEGLKGDQEARHRAVAALGRLGRNAVPAMVAELEDCREEPHPFVDALVMLGPDVVPEVIKVKDEWLGLTTVASVLEEFGPRAAPAVPWLIGKLQRTDAPFGRPEVARTLGRIGPAAKDAVPALIAALGDKNADLRKEAAAALGHIGQDAKAALPALDGLSGDKDASVRLAASAAAWKLRGQPDKAVAALVEGLAADEARRCAMEELGAMGPDARSAGPALAKFFPRSAVAYWQVTGDAGTALNALIPMLSGGNDPAGWAKRDTAIYLLWQMGPAAKPALGWIERGSSSPGAEMETWASWRIRGIDQPPGLRSDVSQASYPLPQTSAPPHETSAGTSSEDSPP